MSKTTRQEQNDVTIERARTAAWDRVLSVMWYCDEAHVRRVREWLTGGLRAETINWPAVSCGTACGCPLSRLRSNLR